MWAQGIRHYADIGVPESADALRNIEECEISIAQYKESKGIPEVSQKTPEELLMSRWCRPSISIVDIKCQEHGREGANQTSFCVIPREATGKVCASCGALCGPVPRLRLISAPPPVPRCVLICIVW